MQDFLKVKGYDSWVRLSAINAISESGGKAIIWLNGGVQISTTSTAKEVIDQIAAAKQEKAPK